jgi:hypothetical protein
LKLRLLFLRLLVFVCHAIILFRNISRKKYLDKDTTGANSISSAKI